MIIQKEVKFALGLTVIFALLAAAIFVYEGENKQPDNGGEAPGGAATALTDGNGNTETGNDVYTENTGTETTEVDNRDPDTKKDTATVSFTDTAPGTRDDGFTTEETEVVAPDNFTEEPEVKTEPEWPETAKDTEPEVYTPDTGKSISDTAAEEEHISTEEIVLPDFEEEEAKETTKHVAEHIPDIPEQTETAEAKTKTVGGTEYTVKKGDMLSTIAKNVYGKGHLWTKIRDANPHIVPEEMMPGQKIIIPKYRQKTRAATVTTEKQPEVFPQGVMVYTIKRGETLGAISKKFYGTSTKWKDILNANNITDEYSVPAGKKIIIPGIKPTPPKDNMPDTEKDSDIPDLSELPDVKGISDSPAGGTNTTHTVGKGETLWNIAQLYFGDGMKHKDIARANPSVNPDRLIPGKKIIIPGVKADTAPDGTQYFIYTVKLGDYLSTIAEDFLGSSSRWKEIAALNGGLNPNKIYAGQKIKIPGSRPGTAADNRKSQEDLPDISFDAKTDAHQYVGSSPKRSKTYTVKQGDTLGEIAQHIYGSVTYKKDIIKANPQIKNPDMLYAGMVLNLPGIRTDRPATDDRSVSNVSEPPVRTKPVSNGTSYLDRKKSQDDRYVLPIERGFGR